tara:strand:+ start:145 stop:1110 length:966 start_codon:yes stop_codon:yes gene_type:complete
MLLSLIIGFRNEIGEDWTNYIIGLEKTKNLDLLMHKEILYNLLSKISINLNFGIYGVNFVTSIIFSTGLVFFCKSLKRSWLALTLSTPYLVIVIGMGYTKQSVALGLLMFGYTFLSRGKIIPYVISILFGSLFHLSSLIALFFVIPFVWNTKKRITNKLLLSSLSLGGVSFLYYLNSTFIAFYILVYLQLDYYSSSGVYIRLFMICVPSILFLILGRNLRMNENEYLLGRWISYYSLLLLGAVFFIPRETNSVIDRLALYALPFFTVIFSNLAELKFVKLNKKYMNVVLVGIAFLTQFVWFNFSGFSKSWLPYQNILLNYF